MTAAHAPGMRFVCLLGAIATTAACYSGPRAAPDANLAWRGHARVELEATLGAPRVALPATDGTAMLKWTHRAHDITLPSGNLALAVTPTSFVGHAEIAPGTIDSYEYDIATAILDPRGTIVAFDSMRVSAGFPVGTNARTGVIFGLAAGVGRLDDAAQPLPALGAYIGGMLGPRVALVGAYQLVSGKDADDELAMGQAWSLGVQYWPTARLSVRGGPAMVLDLDPGLSNARLAPGGMGALSFAALRAGSFVLDVRFDATVSTASSFGLLGVGVNVN